MTGTLSQHSSQAHTAAFRARAERTRLLAASKADRPAKARRQRGGLPRLFGRLRTA